MTQKTDGVEEIEVKVSKMTLQGLGELPPGKSCTLCHILTLYVLISVDTPDDGSRLGESSCHADNASPMPLLTTSASAAVLEDLDYISKFLRSQRPLLLSGCELAFELDPLTNAAFRQRPATSITSANSGSSALRTTEPNNLVILQYENDLLTAITRLRDITDSADHPTVEQIREQLLAEAISELNRIESLKEAEWNRQRAGVPSSRAASDVFDTGEYMRSCFIAGPVVT